MWSCLFMLLMLHNVLGFSIQSGEKIKSLNTKDVVINPNEWSRDGHLQDKERGEGTPYDSEVFLLQRQSCTGLAQSPVEKTVIEYVTVRRFINLLLGRAHFEDVDGNAVPLESLSSFKSDKLVMSFAAYTRPEEIQGLLEFAQGSGMQLRRIDEILSTLASSPEPGLVLSRCNYSLHNWFRGLRDAWQIDFMVVVYILTVGYILWTVKIVLNGDGSWKKIILCFLLPSIVWEFSKSLHEEKLKQYSDELRLGSIPEHCLGWDNRRWWEVFFSRSSKEQCREYHLSKMSHPALRVSIFKVALSHLEQLLAIVVNLTKELTASSPGDGWIKDILMRSVAWMCITLAVVMVVFIYSTSMHPVIRATSAAAALVGWGGSRVEPLEHATEARVEPPPRRRKKSRRGPKAGGAGDSSPSGIVAPAEPVSPSVDVLDGEGCPFSGGSDAEEEGGKEEEEEGREKEGEGREKEGEGREKEGEERE